MRKLARWPWSTGTCGALLLAGLVTMLLRPDTVRASRRSQADRPPVHTTAPSPAASGASDLCLPLRLPPQHALPPTPERN